MTSSVASAGILGKAAGLQESVDIQVSPGHSGDALSSPPLARSAHFGWWCCSLLAQLLEDRLSNLHGPVC